MFKCSKLFQDIPSYSKINPYQSLLIIIIVITVS